METSGHNILSVAQICNQVKFSLENNFSNVWIEGEVASCKTYPSGHIYLVLKDGSSELSAVIFARYTKRLIHYPSVGMRLIVMGDLSLYTPRGQFQLLIKNVHLVGEGSLWLTFEKMKKTFEAEGLFDVSFKKTIPKFPENIGIITSSEGSALHDIINILKRRAPHIKCSLFPVPVQGKSAAEKIAQAIVNMNNYNEIDVLIIGRGGGSLEDLWCFNEEVVVRAIFKSHIPVISAIGHETDTTLSDYAADLRAPTPSAAAELASVNIDEILQKLDHYYLILLRTVKTTIHDYFELLINLQKRHGFFKPQLILQNWKEALDNNSSKLIKNAVNHIYNTKQHLESIIGKLELLDPSAQLLRGYSLAMDEENRVIYSQDQVQIDDNIRLQLAKGELTTKILKKGNKDG